MKSPIGHSFDGKRALELRVLTGPNSSIGASGQMAGSEDRSGHTENSSKETVVLIWMLHLQVS